MDDIGKEGEKDTQHSFVLGGSAPRSNTICNFQQKSLPLSNTRLGDQRTVFKMWINHKGRKFSRLFHSHNILPLALLDLFYRPKWQISLHYYILQLVKHGPFQIPEASKWYPFRTESAPYTGHSKKYPPGNGRITTEKNEKIRCFLFRETLSKKGLFA